MTPISHDVWHHKGLRNTGHIVYETLLRERDVMTIGGLVRTTGRARNTVKKALKRLEAGGLVYLYGNYWAAITVDISYLDDLAVKLGTDGKLKKKKRKHRIEREQYAGIQLLKPSAKGGQNYKQHKPADNS
jgi:DNA-binding transcriptional regulator YhcF (GntR family)